MFINHTSREVTAKIVYYGPGLGGKTTNLQYIFSVTNPITRGELVSIETEIERTLFFDLLPINVGLIKGYQARFQLYTVPGQIFYDSTRKMVLKGADGIVFIADSQELMEQANVESYNNLKTNLSNQNQDVEIVPLTFQYNKRDLNNIISVERLNKLLNQSRRPFFEATATHGTGVIETLREISSLTLVRIKELIDQSHEKIWKKPSIIFDMDKKHKIIKKEELPYKKITVDNIEDYKDKTSPEKVLVESKDVIIPELEKAKAGEKNKEAEKSEPEDHNMDTVEIVNIDVNAKKGDKTNEPKVEKQETVKKEEVKMNESKKDKTFDILDGFEDKSRLTILKKVSIKEPQLSIEIKDKNSNLIDAIELDIDPEVKKITIILDVKK